MIWYNINSYYELLCIYTIPRINKKHLKSGHVRESNILSRSPRPRNRHQLADLGTCERFGVALGPWRVRSSCCFKTVSVGRTPYTIEAYYSWVQWFELFWRSILSWLGLMILQYSSWVQIVQVLLFFLFELIVWTLATGDPCRSVGES